MSARFSRAQSHTCSGHTKNVNSLAWSGGPTPRLASGSDDKSARVWAVDPTGHSKQIAKFDGHGDSVVQLAWDPLDDNRLATLSSDKNVRLWDLRQEKMTHTIPTTFEYINMAWSPDGAQLAVGSCVGGKEDHVKDCVSLLDCRKHELAVHA